MLKAKKSGTKMRGQYKCKICSAILRGEFFQCVKHVRRIHFGEKEFHCERCNDRFAYRKSWINHQQNCDGKSGKVQYENSTPSSSSSSSTAITTTTLYKCKLCEEKFADKPLVRYHLVSVHCKFILNYSKYKLSIIILYLNFI